MGSPETYMETNVQLKSYQSYAKNADKEESTARLRVTVNENDLSCN